jgi:hypothetical protein
MTPETMPMNVISPTSSDTSPARRFVLDLRTIEDIREAVRQVRAQTSDSNLADLAERRLRTFAGEPALCQCERNQRA